MNEEEKYQLACEIEAIKRGLGRVENILCPTSDSTYLSQGEASSRLGVSRHTIARWNVPSIVYGRTRKYRWEDLAQMHRMKRGFAPTGGEEEVAND